MKPRNLENKRNSIMARFFFFEMDYTLSTSRKRTAKMLCLLLFKLTGRSECNCPLKDKHPQSEAGKLSGCKSRMSHTAAACLQR